MPPTPPASPFAALLRRSKFASFDPQIGQVYTSFGGDLHRGNWGLKRPLPLRRRNAHATVTAVDSREQQTEWSSAEQESRWIRMWDEVAITPRVHENSPWDLKIGATGEVEWTIDSEFEGNKQQGFVPKLDRVARKWEARGAKEAEADAEVQAVDPLLEEAKALGVHHAQDMATVNIHAMSDKEFEAYLRKLRELRPRFQRFLEVKSAIDAPKKPQKSTWEHSQRSSEAHKRFLSAQMHVKYDSPDAHVIEQQIHKAGGLMYAKTPALQSYLLGKPRAGRIIRSKLSPTRGQWGYTVSFAGQGAVMDKSFLGRDQAPMDWDELARNGSRDPTRGTGRFKLIGAKLLDAPSVVGPKPSGLMSGIVLSEVRSWDEHGETRPNPYWPGSREYVGKNELVMAPNTGMLKPPVQQPAKAALLPKVKTDQVLNTLVDILERSKAAAKENEKKRPGESHVP